MTRRQVSRTHSVGPPEVVDNMRSWPHSGFSVDQSVYVPAGDRAGIERLVGYITRCPFSLSRLVKATCRDDQEGVSGARNEGSDRSPGYPPLKSGGPVAQRAYVAPTQAPKRILLTRSGYIHLTQFPLGIAANRCRHSYGAEG